MCMAIRAVSSVNFNNYNNISFESRKNKEKHSIKVSKPISHKLAVPTAALILSMIPANVSSTSAWESENRIEYSQESDKREVLQRTNILNASPKYGNCVMELVTDDGGKTGNLILKFEENTKFNGFIDGENGERKKVPMIKKTFHSVEVDTLKTINNHPNKNNLNYSYPTRYVVGKTTIVNIVTRNDGTNVIERYSSKDYPNEHYEITKEFYNDLKNFLGDLVPYKTEDEY